jgi:hypothetical protein
LAYQHVFAERPLEKIGPRQPAGALGIVGADEAVSTVRSLGRSRIYSLI